MRHTFHFISIIVLSLAGCAAVWAQGPNNSGHYYRPAQGKSGAQLKTAMHTIIRNPKVVGYDGLKASYALTDVRPDGYLRDWYSNASQYVPGSDLSSGQKEEGLGYNREHLLPQSWFGKKVDPMYSDIMHVVPTDANLNTIRNDNPLADVTDQAAQVNESKNGYSRWGAPHKDLGAPDGLTKVFEPNDELKGDIARIYFYMITCYEDTLHSWPWRQSRTATYVFDEEGTAYEPLQQWVMDMFMRWSEQDPVDSIELARNEAVFRVQGNRNPYVDYPGLEQYVWGEQSDEPFDYADGADDDTPDVLKEETTIALNARFFGVDWTGTRPAGGASVLRGEKDGIVVEYALGNNGRNMYANNSQMRLYQKNLLCFSTTVGQLEEITLKVTKNDAAKVFSASVGEMDGYSWTGSSSEVRFQLDDGNGVVYLTECTVRRGATQGVEPVIDTASDFAAASSTAVYDLSGRRMDGTSLAPGIYIRAGRKFVVAQ